MKRLKRYYDDADANDVIPPGGRIRVTLADSQHARQRRAADAVAHDCRVWSGHRPGPCSDAFGPALTMDGAYSTAFAMRDQAFADLCKRSENAWRRPFPDAVGVSGPLAPALNVAGTLPPDDADDDDDNDDNNDNNSNSDPLAKAM